MVEDSLRERVGALEDRVEGNTLKFKARASQGIQTVFKADDRFIVWGPASLEVVDKENDKITADALEEALPQLLKRSRLSVDHSDQLVGDILENFSVDDPVTVKIDGDEYTRTEFPTGVLKLDGKEPGLYVAGEVWEDTRQSREMREKINDGEVTSYSISGDAITDSTEYKDGELYDEITEMDLSAVTLCEDGMNPEASFDVVTKRLDDSTGPSSSPSAVSKDSKMGDQSNDDNEENHPPSNLSELDKGDLEALSDEFKSAAEDVLEGKYASQDDVAELKSEFESFKEEMGGNPRFSEEDDEDEEDEEEADAPDPSPDEEDEEKGDDFPDEEDEEMEEPDDEPPEDPEGDLDDEDDPLDAPDDPDVDPMEGGEESDTLTIDEIEEKCPDDLAEAVKEHLKSDEVDPEADPEEEEAEEEMPPDEEDEEESTEKSEDVSPDFLSEGDDPIEKAANRVVTGGTGMGPVSSEEEHFAEDDSVTKDDEDDSPSMGTARRAILKNDAGVNMEDDEQ